MLGKRARQHSLVKFSLLVIGGRAVPTTTNGNMGKMDRDMMPMQTLNLELLEHLMDTV
jgi:hypothetical protein